MGQDLSVPSLLHSCPYISGPPEGQFRKTPSLGCSLADGILCVCFDGARDTGTGVLELSSPRHDPPLFLGHAALFDVISGMRTKDEWVRLLLSGVVVSLEGELVTLRFELETWCITVREHTAKCIYLHDLEDCQRLPRSSGSTSFELVLSFCGPSNKLVFQFDDEVARDTFAATLEELAGDAKHAH
mmetsp:Transcript_2432/g.7096  ORF Transcript_2432/g.7096 Transcript_2432/m.7096 type:complete len:186 (-) Transcript_2432:322-879(-)